MLTALRKLQSGSKKDSEDFLNVILGSGSWIWEVDVDGRYIYSAGKVKEILGYSHNEIIGKTPFDLMPTEESQKIKELFEGIVAKRGKIVNLENWNIRKDGEKICMLTNGVPIINDCGELIGYRGVDKDISNLKESRLELKWANRQLKATIERASKLTLQLEDENLSMCKTLSIMRDDVKKPLDYIVDTVKRMQKWDVGHNEKNELKNLSDTANRLTLAVEKAVEQFNLQINIP